MSTHKSPKLFLILLIALGLVLGACGTAAPAEEVAPVQEAAEMEAPIQEVAEFDLVAVVDEAMTTIPEGFLAMGDIAKFKDAMANGAFVVDVREVAEYEAGHIEGAINVPLRTLAQNLDKIPTDMPVFIHCKSGHRAAMAISAMQMLGYDNVRSFPPGMKGWNAAEEELSMEPVVAETYDVPAIEPELLTAVDEFLSTIPEGFLAMGDIEKFNDARANGAFVVDVREVAEYEAGHIEGAINVPLRTLVQNLDQIPTDTPVFVHCKSGHRAAMAITALQTVGYTNVRSFPPGMNGWTAAGQPVAALQ